MTPDVSIVIINWNTRDLLRACLQSIVDHANARRCEIIVVDNASTDGSAEMVDASFPHVRLLRNATNRGFAAANNQAMRVCRGQHILLLNSDTEIRGDVIERAVEYFDAHPEIGVLGCRVLNPDGSLQRTCFRFPSLAYLGVATLGLHKLPWPRWLGWYEMRSWERDDVRSVDVVTGCFMLVRRAAIESVGGLDESYFFYGEETDWCLRIRDAGWDVRFAPVGHIIHHGNASGLNLHERRGLLLAEALVRLHHVHRGPASAVAAWTILAVHAASRAILHAGFGLLPTRLRPTAKWRYCAAIAGRFRAAWPHRPRERRVPDVCPPVELKWSDNRTIARAA